MKREDVMSILADENLDNESKLSKILDLNGSDINAKNKRITELENAAKTHEDAMKEATEKVKGYDAILKERDDLKAEKESREFSERFSAVLEGRKPKNDFTKNGLIDLFKGEVAKEENSGKKDAEIFKALVEGHENEYFEAKVKFNMVPANPNITVPSDTQAYLDSVYKDNPFYNSKT